MLSETGFRGYIWEKFEGVSLTQVLGSHQTKKKKSQNDAFAYGKAIMMIGQREG